MNKLLIILKAFLNFCLFLFYSLLTGIILDFVYGFVLKVVLGKAVPGPFDPIHQKIAVIGIMIVLIFTFVFKKVFYLKLKKPIYEQAKVQKTKEKNTKKKKIEEKEETEIDNKKTK